MIFRLSENSGENQVADVYSTRNMVHKMGGFDGNIQQYLCCVCNGRRKLSLKI